MLRSTGPQISLRDQNNPFKWFRTWNDVQKKVTSYKIYHRAPGATFESCTMIVDITVAHFICFHNIIDSHHGPLSVDI